MPEYTPTLSVAVTNQTIPQLSTATITTDVANTTGSKTIFTVTGAIEVLGIWGVITTTLSSNHTAAYLEINDQTASPDITLATGVTLSSKTAGSVLVKKGLATAALVLLDNAAGVVSEPTTLETSYFSPFVVVKKTAAATTIQYTYTTTNNPSTGAIQWFMRWLPLSADAAVT